MIEIRHYYFDDAAYCNFLLNHISLSDYSQALHFLIMLSLFIIFTNTRCSLFIPILLYDGTARYTNDFSGDTYYYRPIINHIVEVIIF